MNVIEFIRDLWKLTEINISSNNNNFNSIELRLMNKGTEFICLKTNNPTKEYSK